MADFVAVIRKAVDNLSDNSPDNRAKVYEKARSAIRRQLEAMTPRPSEEMISRQLSKLGDAIEEVESENAVALPPDEEETDRLMAELEALVEDKPAAVTSAPAPKAPEASAPTPAPIMAKPAAPTVPTPETVEPELPDTSASIAPPESTVQKAASQPFLDVPRDPFDDREVVAGNKEYEPVVGKEDVLSAGRDASSVLTGTSHDEAFGLGEAPSEVKPDTLRGSKQSDPSVQPMQVTRHRKKSGSMGWVVGVAVLLLVAGAGYAAWMQKDALMAMFSGSDATQQNSGMTPIKTAPGTSTEAPVEKPATEVAAVEPEQSLAEPDGKFTQRLNADGSETDPGPSPAVSDAGPVEGRSVAAQTDPVEAPAMTAPEVAVTTETPQEGAGAEVAEGTDTAEEQPEEPGAAAQADEPLGVAQKMYLYEERLDQQSPAVTEGSVAWSTIADPENGGPNNLAIRGEISTSDGFSALVTIKRNIDRSLPASHIIEVVFALSPEFPGGSISQLQRVSMKQTEQDQGDPLIAVPAQITSDFYMVALNDLSEAVDANLALLRDRNWIDIPVAYDNGRRALITIEKGATGSEVFNQVLDVWAAR